MAIPRIGRIFSRIGWTPMSLPRQRQLHQRGSRRKKPFRSGLRRHRRALATTSLRFAGCDVCNGSSGSRRRTCRHRNRRALQVLDPGRTDSASGPSPAPSCRSASNAAYHGLLRVASVGPWLARTSVSFCWAVTFFGSALIAACRLAMASSLRPSCPSTIPSPV